jgi:hypothetical protein
VTWFSLLNRKQCLLAVPYNSIHAADQPPRRLLQGASVKISSIFLAVCLCATGVIANCQPADQKATLAAITARGRALYEYDQAAAKGTDAIFSLKPQPTTKGLTHYLCIHTSRGWRVVFPQWDMSHLHIMVAYEATESIPDKTYKARKVDPPQAAGGDLQIEAVALELALSDFESPEKPKRPYNTAVLPAPHGQFYVYLYPGQIKENVWPIGGDYRYTISSDAQSIVDKHQMHKAIQDSAPKAGSNEVAGYHFHVVTDLPEDTDVLYVLNRKPAMPEYVGINQGKMFFLINTDGTITTAEDKKDSVRPKAPAPPSGTGSATKPATTPK